MKNTLKKAERLNSKKLIEELFQKGSYFYFYPFKIFYLKEPASTNHQVLISVPKRTFKKAVERNKLKRRIREAYRLNKEKLAVSENLLLGYIYTSRKIENYNVIESGVIKALTKLNNLD